jgi:hypothetical protein
MAARQHTQEERPKSRASCALSTEMNGLRTNPIARQAFFGTSLNSANFGKIGGGVQGITTRVIQVGAKLYF